ncbi:helix-turn-helix domain-containing protein [Rhodobium gokarnense]|uniref:CRP/FNR family transcriptional regulator n=1 Tax=Rhodobium gokarnense TaxID=364296 RepID=A0ABT3H7U2_9HYPH|nr:helix-turn-helix domain-containing protein [Rhodobium gokarnense]MCW2306460.1 CRP/FNR family transcriptional regulator [Rhodobium gokarnense]
MAYLHNEIRNETHLVPGLPVDGEQAWSDFMNSVNTKICRFAQHDVIFYEGDMADRVFEIVEGAVMLYKLLPDGRRQVVEMLGPQALFGIPAHGIYDCAAETLVPTVLRSLRRRDLEEQMDLQQHITRCLLSQMERLHDHAVLLGRKSATERVASFLFRFVANRGGVGCTGPAKGETDEETVRLNMTRQEIADFLGLTIETVSRVFSDMKRRGVICIEKTDQIRINNVCGLCHLTGAH